jgi:DNA/RNA-binding domain of Phe-tRNA-synthetase-like protein
MTLDIEVSETWTPTFPGAFVGALAMTAVANPPVSEVLFAHLRQVEADVRSRFGDPAIDLAADPVLAAYRAHYRQFDKTYHVQGQLDSVARKGKSISGRGALVEAMFAAEIADRLLTAGHDLEAVEMPILVDVSREDDRFVTIAGREQRLKAGDMLVRDRQGIISDVLYGPDHRTRLGPETSRALFVTYAPAGIGAEAVRRHLLTIAANVHLVTPGATVSGLQIAPAAA